MGDPDGNSIAMRQSLDQEPIKAQGRAHGDKALDFLDAHEAVTFTKEEERAVVRKIDWVLMPLVSSMFIDIRSPALSESR